MKFSRFPYYLYDDVKEKTNNSEISSLKYKLGNCVGFAYYFRKHFTDLNPQYKCFLIPASCPKSFKRQNYSNLCHVADCIPFNNGFIIVDTAFYIQKPIILSGNSIFELDKKSIYTESNDQCRFQLGFSKKNIRWSSNGIDHQIPKDIYFVNSTYNNDKYFYFLINIDNPDDSITLHTNYTDERIFVSSTDKHGTPEGYSCIKVNNKELTGYLNRDYFPSLYFNSFVTQNDKDITIDSKKLFNWEGLSEKQAKVLKVDHNKLKNDFLDIIKLYYKDKKVTVK